jgi:hypothetical protein
VLPCRITSTAVLVGVSLVLVTSLTVFAAPAFATGSVSGSGDTAAEQPLELGVSREDVSLGWMPIRFVSTTTSPSSIRVGMPCGMEGMCGLKPCLCGSAVDQWGGCACNGFETVEPALTVTTSDNSIVRVMKIGGAYLLCPTGPGRATVTVRGHLVNYTDAESQFTVHVTLAGLVMFYVFGAVFVAAIAGVVLAPLRAWRSIRARRSRAGSEVLTRRKEEGQ